MTRQHLIHYLARCHGCAAQCTAKNVQAWAHNHARRTGHRVELSLGYVVGPEEGAPVVRMYTAEEIAIAAAQLPPRRKSSPDEIRQRIQKRREAWAR